MNVYLSAATTEIETTTLSTTTSAAISGDISNLSRNFYSV